MTDSIPVFTASLLTPEPWTVDALCAQTDPDMFFPGKGDHIAAKAARTVCNACLVAAECLAYALRTYEDEGVWGGMTAQQRKKMRAKSPRTCRDCCTQIGERAPHAIYCAPCAADRRRRRYQA